MPLSLIASNWLNMLSTVLWELTTQRVAYFIVEGLTSLFCFVYFLTSSHLGFLFFLLQQQFRLADLNTDQKINTIIIRLVVDLFISCLFSYGLSVKFRFFAILQKKKKNNNNNLSLHLVHKWKSPGESSYVVYIVHTVRKCVLLTNYAYLFKSIKPLQCIGLCYGYFYLDSQYCVPFYVCYMVF